MERPVSMPLREFLVKKLSLKLTTSEKIINEVISHQFSSAFQATAYHNSIEISGYGKFIFSQVKAKKLFDKYTEQIEIFKRYMEDETLSDERRKKETVRYNTAVSNLNNLKERLSHGIK